jgi:cold shock CspA family protein
MPQNPRPNEDAITQGTVKSVNTDSGYGFIIASDIPEDIFFHRTACNRLTIRPGDVVTFGYRLTEEGRYRATRIIEVGGSK